MSDNIKLHPKYGLNPSISQCIICGKDFEIVLFGGAIKEEAPMHCGVRSPEPCEDCKKKYLKEGVLLIEIENENEGVLTGRIAVIKDEAFNRVFNTSLPEKKIAFVEIGVLDQIGIKKGGRAK